MLFRLDIVQTGRLRLSPQNSEQFGCIDCGRPADWLQDNNPWWRCTREWVLLWGLLCFEVKIRHCSIFGGSSENSCSMSIAITRRTYQKVTKGKMRTGYHSVAEGKNNVINVELWCTFFEDCHLSYSYSYIALLRNIQRIIIPQMEVMLRCEQAC